MPEQERESVDLPIPDLDTVIQTSQDLEASIKTLDAESRRPTQKEPFAIMNLLPVVRKLIQQQSRLTAWIAGLADEVGWFDEDEGLEAPEVPISFLVVTEALEALAGLGQQQLIADLWQVIAGQSLMLPLSLYNPIRDALQGSNEPRTAMIALTLQAEAEGRPVEEVMAAFERFAADEAAKAQAAGQAPAETTAPAVENDHAGSTPQQ